MTFVSPWLTLGMLAVVIPIAIHLFLRRQPQKIVFPALRFVQQVEQKAKRSLRVRHILLLLCRIGLIILLALLLARPSLKRQLSANASSPTATALAFDTSIRMNCQRDNESLFDFALKEGQWVLSRLPAGSQIAIIDSQTKTAAFAVDRSAAKYQMEQLKPGPNAFDFTSQIIKAAQVLETSPLNVRELYIFTDMSKSAWDAASAPIVADSLKKAGSPAVYVIDVSSSTLVNDSVCPVQLEKEILSPSDRLDLTVTVKRERISDDAKALATNNRTLELYILDESDKPVKRGEKILSAEPEQTIRFSLSGFEPGWYEGYVQLSGADAFVEDDCRWFSFRRSTPKKALIVYADDLHSAGASQPATRSSQLLAEALSPKLWRAEGKNRYDCTVVSQREFDSEDFDADKMTGFDVAFLLNPAPMSPAGWKKLETWTSQGGGLCVALGDNASDVKAFNSPESQTVLAGTAQMQARAGAADVFLFSRSFVHPILAPFGKMNRPVPWLDAAVYRYWQMSDFSPDVSVILRYSDLRPFMLERPVGSGRAITITSPINDVKGNWNAFASAQSWLFFALINQTADYLSSADAGRLNYRAGEMAEIKTNGENTEWSITNCTAQPGKDSASVRNDGSQTIRAQNNFVHIPGLISAGYIVANPETDAANKIFLSFNYSEKDTDFSRFDVKDLPAFFGACPWTQSRDRMQIERNVSTGRVGWELFPILAAALCLLIAAETWLSQRFYR